VCLCGGSPDWKLRLPVWYALHAEMDLQLTNYINVKMTVACFFEAIKIVGTLNTFVS
jgi:hypothetical protein